MLHASPDVVGRIEELKKKIAMLEKANKIYEKLHNKLMHEYPEKSGRYFISGESGDKDKNGLPEAISVCPAYGADFTVTYVRVEDTMNTEFEPVKLKDIVWRHFQNE